jgi:hypothetical protein
MLVHILYKYGLKKSYYSSVIREHCNGDVLPCMSQIVYFIMSECVAEQVFVLKGERGQFYSNIVWDCRRRNTFS